MNIKIIFVWICFQTKRICNKKDYIKFSFYGYGSYNNSVAHLWGNMNFFIITFLTKIFNWLQSACSKERTNIMKHAKIFLTFLIILSCFTAGFSMTALAGNDNVAFSFTMKANSARNYTGDRYRETTRTNNPWWILTSVDIKSIIGNKNSRNINPSLILSLIILFK